MIKALKSINKFINYTRQHGSQKNITLHDLFFLQDYIHNDLEYCKDQHVRAAAILAKMDQNSPDVKIIKEYVDNMDKLK